MHVDTEPFPNHPMNSRAKHLQPCVAVDVFLPKNLTNFPVLIKVLKDTLAFRPALRYLFKHAADIHLKYEPSPVRRASSFNPGPEPEILASDLKTFKRRLSEIKKRVYGYSIFEVDGAFDQISNSSIISAGRKHHHRVGPRHAADRYFKRYSPHFARELGAHLFPRLSFDYKKSSLHPHPSHVANTKRRLWVHGDDRFDVERTDTEFLAQRCLTVVEERVLMVRLMAMPTEKEQKGWSDDNFSVWTPDLNAVVARVLWDTLIVVGCFMARRLGLESNIEDQIWITYDVRALWIWRKGEPMLATDEGQQ